jgi:hypothetical protein
MKGRVILMWCESNCAPTLPFHPRLMQDLRRYASQNWVYHLISANNHDAIVLDKVIHFVDTSLKEFGVWMTRAGSWDAVDRINNDLTTSSIRLQQIKHPGLQSKLRIAIRRINVRCFVVGLCDRLTAYIFSSR